MIIDHLSQSPGTARPDQLAMLQRVFDRTCAASGIEKRTPQAEGLAATILRLFHEGVQDEEKLEDLVSRIDFI